MTLIYDLCCSSSYFKYRASFLDPEYPFLAARGSASVTGIFKLPEGHALGAQYNEKTFFADLTKRGVWWFDDDDDEFPHVCLQRNFTNSHLHLNC